MSLSDSYPQDQTHVTTPWGEAPHGWMGERLPDPDSDLWKQYYAHVQAL